LKTQQENVKFNKKSNSKKGYFVNILLKENQGEGAQISSSPIARF
jgi:hypothetical protein